jgi:hypothetical protein
MYESLQKWDDAIELARARQAHAQLATLTSKYQRHLAETGQDEKAAEVCAAGERIY